MSGRSKACFFAKSIGATLVAILLTSTPSLLSAIPTSSDEELQTLAGRADSLYDAAAYPEVLAVATRGIELLYERHEIDPHERTTWLLRAARANLKLGRLDEAETLLQDAMASVAHPDSGSRTDELSVSRTRRWLLMEREDWARAEELGRESLLLSREIYGPDGPEVADELIALASLVLTQDKTDEATALLEEATALLEQQPSSFDRMRAELLMTKSQLEKDLGNYNEASALAAQSVEIQERLWGEDHPDVAIALSDLADICQVQGDLVRAEDLLRRSLAILDRTYGPNHLRSAVPLNNLGVVLRRRGDFRGAGQAYERSLAARISAHGEDHPSIAVPMVNLSALKRALGNHVEAIRLLRRAVEIIETGYGPDHTKTAWALSHLAQVERQRGSPREAEALFRRCLRIAEEAYGPDHLDTVLYEVGIAQCLRDQGRLEEALGFFRRAVETGSSLLGADNHEVTRYRRELAVVLLLLGRTEEARSILEECLSIFETQLGADHPATDQCLAGLTIAGLTERDIERARIHADRNLAAAERTFGEKGLRRSLLMKVTVEAVAQNWTTAASTGIRAAKIALAAQDDLFQVSSEHEILQYAADHRRVLGTLLAAVQGALDLPDSTLAEVFSLVARESGQVVDRFAQRRQFLEMAHDTSTTTPLCDAYLAATEKLADRIVQGPKGRPEEYQEAVTRARREKEAAERALAEASERFRRSIALRDQEILSTGTVAARLAPGTVLVQFVRFPRLTVGTEDWRPGAASLEECLFSGGEDHYGAFRLDAGSKEEWDLGFVNLGPAGPLDSFVTVYRKAVEAVAAGSRPTARQEAEYRAAARRLYEQVWAPIFADGRPRRSGAGGPEVPTVFLVPTSRLHLVDFNTLLSPDGDLVIERWRLHLLSSIRDLMRPGEENGAHPGRGLLAVGNPAPARSAPFLADLRAEQVPLPGAEAEAREIAELVTKVTHEAAATLVGDKATEDAVKLCMRGKRIVHLATHGFFLQENEGPIGRTGGDELQQDPLLHCGLLLAAGTEEDGLLTAQEIVAHDLRGLDWVVLSACNSGLGTLVPGEGLFGLRRAFEIAGARTVVMALWRIDDTTTRGLMKSLYRHRLEGDSTADALRSAQLERLTEQRLRTNRIHPAFWGGIVAEGDWR